MKYLLYPALSWATFCGAALAQGATVTVGPNGVLQGGVSVPGAPPVGVRAGNGQATTSPAGPPPDVSAPSATYSGGYAGPGRSVTVRSPDGSASSSVSVTGDNAAVSASGSPGSHITVEPGPDRRTRICPKGASRAYQQRTGCRTAPQPR